jgi:glycosyltransferase involved in cell wall biosynthesis
VWEKKSPLIRRLVARVDAVASISRFTRDRMSTWARMSKELVVVLPNAIDLDEFDRKLMHHPDFRVEGKPVLLTLGRMDPAERGKGFDEMIDALPELLKEYPDLMYYAAGDGLDRQRLQQRARDRGVEKHVVFPGYIPEDEKPALFRAADVYVMPGRLEGFGYVFLESLAAGTPVIGSTRDASGEAMMDGKWGMLVDPLHRHQLVSAIRATLTNSKVPQRSELEYFSKSAFTRRAHAMIDRVLSSD